MSATLLAQGGIEQMGVINAHRHGARRKNRHAHGRTSQCLAPVRRLQSGQARHRMIGDVGAKHGMSEETRSYVDAFWMLIDEILNAVLFLMIGFEVFAVVLDTDILTTAVLSISLALAGRLAAAQMRNETLASVPDTTATGALVTHITGGADAKTFQPMNVNFGLFPPVEGLKGGRRGRKDRYKAYTDRAKLDWQAWLDQ